MGTSRNLSTVYSTTLDKGRPLATRTGKVIHRLERAYLSQGKAETSCHKFLKVVTLVHQTLAEKKGRWGVVLGTGTVPTCRGCYLAHVKWVEETTS
jgi:hypothetical protein